MFFYIYGKGGHSSVINSIIKEKGHFSELVLEEDIKNCKKDFPFIVAIGDNAIRKEIHERLTTDSFKIIEFPIISNNAYVHESCIIGAGSVVCPGATLMNDVVVGSGVIINTNASINHHSIIEDFVHIAPGVNLCGNVFVGELSSLYVGSSVGPNTKIGRNCTISGGSFLKKNLQDNSYFKGI